MWSFVKDYLIITGRLQMGISALSLLKMQEHLELGKKEGRQPYQDGRMFTI